jgi:hypothetical protein
MDMPSDNTSKLHYWTHHILIDWVLWWQTIIARREYKKQQREVPTKTINDLLKPRQPATINNSPTRIGNSR